MTMYCQTDANPPADVYQFFYGGDLIAITNNGAHHLITVEKGHEGDYHCKAINTLGLGDTAYMFLRVKGKSVSTDAWKIERTSRKKSMKERRKERVTSLKSIFDYVSSVK